MGSLAAGLREQWWPDVRDRWGARSAAIQGFAGAVLQVVIALALAGRAASKGSFLGIKPVTFLIAAAIFGAIAIGIWRLSRAASVAGLVLFLPDAIWWLLYDHRLSDTARTLLMTVLFGLLFVNGVRGTFGYHKFIVEEPGADAPRLSKNEKEAM